MKKQVSTQHDNHYKSIEENMLNNVTIRLKWKVIGTPISKHDLVQNKAFLESASLGLKKAA